MLMRTSIAIIFAVMSIAVQAQPTRVRGRVTDANTGEPLPFVSVIFPGTTVGTTTDDEGIYSVESREQADSVQAIYIGYRTQTLPVQPHRFNNIDIRLEQEGFSIDDVVVLSGPNPAHPLLDSVNRYKYKNDPANLDKYSVSTYTKMQLDLSNIKRRSFKNKRMQRNFGFIFDHVDTSAMTGQSYLPVMISESAADYYHSKNPAVSREIIRASRTSGFSDNYTIAQFTGQLYADVNPYDNYIELFKIKFAGPLSGHGRMIYNYFLVDSMNIEGRKTYKVRFHPKSLATPVLDGEINIDSATYALRSAHMHMPKGNNVNWIRHLQIDNENRPVNDTLWFRKNDRLSADFSIVMSDSSKLTSFIGTREIAYSDFRPGAELPANVRAMDNRIVVDEDVTHNDEKFWDSIRPYELSQKEKSIYRMVDSVQSTPLYRNIYTIINTIIGGYYNTKYVGIGPYSRIFSFNKIEGARFQIGGRTTENLSNRVRLSGYAAYGTRDEAFKGGVGVELMFRRSLTRKLELRYMHDMQQLGESDKAISSANLLGSIFSRGNKRMSIIDRADIIYEHEWRHGLSNFLALQGQRIQANAFVPMIRPDGRMMESVGNVSLRVGMRMSFNETIVRRPFDKYHLSSKYPIVGIDFTTGFKGLLHNDFEYYRLEGEMRYRIPVPPLGYSTVTLQGGHIFGHVPYVLLKLPEGNGTYFYDSTAFSCMDFYEFAADSWLSLFYEHHFNGFFLGRIPFMKRMKMREVITFKGIYGTLSKGNDGSLPDTQAVLLFPEGMTSVSDPYLEAGFGIENIFRLLRVDFVWRLTHRDRTRYDNVQNFAVNLSLRMQF